MTKNRTLGRNLAVSIIGIGALLLTACSAGSPGGPDGGKGPDVVAALSGSITVNEAGGSYGNFMKKEVMAPFSKETGVEVIGIPSLTVQTLAKLRASANSVHGDLDLASFDPPGAYPAANEGLLLKLDPKKLPNMKYEHDWAIQKDGQLVGVLSDNQCLVYNTDKIKTEPTSWMDLYDPAYKGKVILPDISTSHGLYNIALMSGIATDGEDYYDTDAAFEMLEKLKPNILTYWTNHDQAAQLLNSGEAWIAPWVADRATFQISQGAPMECTLPKEGAVSFVSYAGIAKNTANPDAAYAYLNLWISAETQKKASEQIFLGPTNSKVELTGLVKEYLDPTRERLIRLDWDKLIKLAPEWTDRWNATMTN